MSGLGTKKTIKLTQEGLAELQAELLELVDVKLPEAVKRLANARSHGDLSENSDYQNAKEEQQLIEARIDEVQEILSNAQVVKHTTSHEQVGMGSVVTVSLSGKKGKTFTYHLVGEFEADPKEGKISADSPLGLALLGKKPGDQIKVSAPAGEVSYLIEKIQ